MRGTNLISVKSFKNSFLGRKLNKMKECQTIAFKHYVRSNDLNTDEIFPSRNLIVFVRIWLQFQTHKQIKIVPTNLSKIIRFTKKAFFSFLFSVLIYQLRYWNNAFWRWPVQLSFSVYSFESIESIPPSEVFRVQRFAKWWSRQFP